MATNTPPMWAKVIASVVTAMIMILLLVIVTGVLVNLAIAIWT